MDHWTNRYFGQLYHEIYSQYILEPERALEEAAFAAQVLDLGRRTVLDLACGFGRHARLLAASNRVVALQAGDEDAWRALAATAFGGRVELGDDLGNEATFPFITKADAGIEDVLTAEGRESHRKKKKNGKRKMRLRREHAFSAIRPTKTRSANRKWTHFQFSSLVVLTSTTS